MKNQRIRLQHGLILLGTMAGCTASPQPEKPERPNVILIMTDDQGYGDIASHGHPHLITPNMDRLRDMSIRLDNFHVDPTCAPTRSALMTGRYSGRVGVWHALMGRSILREDETTIAEVFRDAGYRTGIYGKWHLGDSYPYGARFRGFDDAIVHYGGGVGQAPDYWGNDYFEDHYNDNGEWRRFQGYCTDVWFREALRFIRESKGRPFFLYLPTNAAHQTRPHVAERYKALYNEVDTNDRLRVFWGMITNIDDNLGVMMDRLEQWELLDNTIIVFMGDNGSNMGEVNPRQDQTTLYEPYNAGMRGYKQSQYDGGHRVFGFIYYPPAGIQGGRDVNQITAHIDIMPTLLELCNIPKPEHIEFDGKSLVPLLTGNGQDWPERTLFVHNQMVIDPIKWRRTSVMTDRWRLVDNTELYDIMEDPGQQNNIINDHPELTQRLREEYDTWWDDIGRKFHETTPLYVGTENENPVHLNSFDWVLVGAIPVWNQPLILDRPKTNGPWRIRVAESGRYAFTLRERPEVAAFPLTATEARLRVGNLTDEKQKVERGATAVRFEVELKAGDTELQTWLIESDGSYRGAYFTEVERLSGR